MSQTLEFTKSIQPKLNEVLKDRTIAAVRYMSQEEAKSMSWDSRPLVLHLDNGTLLFISRDDEGNDGGSLFYQTRDNKDGVFGTI
jgi:hypothetical protein